ncbi:MAG: hypothetical protein Q7R60_02730 [bacterium]|nr:hypothetical protein [bacterium]
MNPHNRKPSPDIYPGLDEELEAVYRRNVAEGRAKPAEDVAVPGLETVVDEQLQQRKPELNLSQEAASWARNELENHGALEKWLPYHQAIEQDIPNLLDVLLEGSPNLAPVIEKLYKAKQDLTASGEVSPEGLNIGETMRLVLMPWRTIKDNLERLPEWIKEMRDTQGIATEDDYFNGDLLKALQGDVELYRNPIAGHFFATNGTTAPKWITAKQYLEQRIATEGDWGVMLVQTSDDAGLKRLVEGPDEQRTPNALTNSGTVHFKVANHDVDAMGIFEWLSVTFQEDPSKLSSRDVSWLLANRFELEGSPCVPLGDWFGRQVGSRLNNAGRLDDWRPRLAVM